MNQDTPRIAVTPGEPAGIGPDGLLELASVDWPAELVAIADPALLESRAAQLGLAVDCQAFDPGSPRRPSPAGRLLVQPVRLRRAAVAGRLDAHNAGYVLATLRDACAGCESGRFDALVTGPVHKGIINDSGEPFSGHTEFLAAQTGTPLPVMLLVAGTLRVALATTHLPLRAVPEQITTGRLTATLKVLDDGLRRCFAIAAPRITVLGLNPHAGESGHLGTEDRDIILPAIEALRREGLNLRGPVPADTAFVPQQLEQTDAVLAMYHDQGLPVLKHQGFGRAVNVTLGLPILRTSVDHGTALELAGSGRADAGSFAAALKLAIELSRNRSE